VIISFGNFKGGVGKTTTTSLFGYILSEFKNKKVLLVDTDQQADLSDEVENTYQISLDRNLNLYNACFEEVTVKSQIQSISNNLDILAGHTKMRNFANTIKELYSRKDEQHFHHQIMNEALKEVKDLYDYVLLDTNPAVDLLTENVLFSSDYVIIPTKSLARDREDTKVFNNYLVDFAETYNFQLIGVIAYLVEDTATDKKIINSYKELFGNELFENIIKNSAVVKRWSAEGITLDRSYDKRTMSMYESVVDEALNRINNERINK